MACFAGNIYPCYPNRIRIIEILKAKKQTLWTFPLYLYIYINSRHSRHMHDFPYNRG